MTSFAQELGPSGGASFGSPLSTPFSEARGQPFSPFGTMAARQAEDKAGAAASKAGSFDTLDLNPPTPEKALLEKIQTLLNDGEFAEAARHLQQISDNKADYNFTPQQEHQFFNLITQTQEIAAANNAPDVFNDMAELMADFLSSLVVKGRDPKDEMEDIVQTLTVGEGLGVIALGLFG